MSNAAIHYDSLHADSEVRQCFGTVVEATGEDLLVWSQTGRPIRQPARRAPSCLVAPKVGDRVLLAVGAGEGFVLAVLEQARDEPLTLSAPGAGDLTVRASTLRLAASEGLDVVSGGALRWVARRLALRAPEAEIALEETTFVGKLFRAQLRKAQLVADTVDTLAERLVQRVQRAYRTVTHTDQLRAGTVDYRADELMALRGAHTVMTARELVKVDAGQIHMG